MGLPLRIVKLPNPNPVYDDLSQSGERPIERPEGRESFLRLVPQEPAKLPSRMDVFGVPVTTASAHDVQKWFFDAVHTRARLPKVMLFAGAASFAKAWDDAGHRERMSQADVVLPEGAGLVAYAALAAAPIESIGSAALMLHKLLASVDPARPLRVFLIGKDKIALGEMGRAIEQRFTYVDVVGVADARPDACLSERIAEECVDLVLVGIGDGRDELWIEENVDLLDVGVVVGVGHALEAVAGTRAASPRATTRLGFVSAIRFLVHATLYLALPWLRPASALNG